MEFTMRSTLSLSQYVKKRNGVPLGASHSMRNMLSRSFGAKSFPIFLAVLEPHLELLLIPQCHATASLFSSYFPFYSYHIFSQRSAS